MTQLTNSAFAAIVTRIAIKSSSYAAGPIEAMHGGMAPADGKVSKNVADEYCDEISTHLNLIKRLSAGDTGRKR